MTHHIYVDESGDEGDYLDSNEKPIIGSSRYFILAGIIVDEHTVPRFEEEYNHMLHNRFRGKPLPENFKLHYYPLRNNKPPYDRLSVEDRQGLEKDVFDVINRLDCTLVSVIIDLDTHCRKYTEPISPRAYALYLLQERFQYFLEEYDSHGVVIYERFNAKMKRRTEQVIRRLRTHNFPIPISLPRIDPHIQNGDPTQQPILNLADFFAYLPYTYKTSGRYSPHYELIMHKYFNLHGDRFHTGKVEL